MQRQRFHNQYQYLFIESICNDNVVLEQNYQYKMMYSPDYADFHNEQVPSPPPPPLSPLSCCVRYRCKVTCTCSLSSDPLVLTDSRCLTRVGLLQNRSSSNLVAGPSRRPDKQQPTSATAAGRLCPLKVRVPYRVCLVPCRSRMTSESVGSRFSCIGSWQRSHLHGHIDWASTDCCRQLWRTSGTAFGDTRRSTRPSPTVTCTTSSS